MSHDQQNDRPQLWTAADVAEFLGITRLTVMLWSRQGRVPGKKVGHVWRYSPAVIRRWAGDKEAEDETLIGEASHRGLWTQADTARYFRVTPQSVGLWARRQQIPATRVGYCWRFHPQTIQEWVEAGEPLPKLASSSDR